MDDQIEYPYHPSIKMLVLAVIGFAAAGLFLAHTAETNDQGLIIDRVIELSPQNATIFYWVLASLAGGFVAIGLLAMAELSFASEKPVLRLTRDEVIIPPYLFRREPRNILYRDITSLSVRDVGRQQFLYIHHGDRKKAPINREWLPDKAAYAAVVGFIAEKVKQNSPR